MLNVQHSFKYLFLTFIVVFVQFSRSKFACYVRHFKKKQPIKINILNFHCQAFICLFFKTCNDMGLSGLEPPTSRLSGVRSNQLSYRPTIEKVIGAGDGDRTHDISLEGWSFTTKLHPHI